MFWAFAFWVLLPLLVLLAATWALAALVRRRRYHPTADDYTDWSAKAARQAQGDHFDHHGSGW
jgi:hypothetical protein